jgi:hypothetical protein
MLGYFFAAILWPRTPINGTRHNLLKPDACAASLALAMAFCTGIISDTR